MKKVEKKAWPEYFEEVLRGRKTFDLRLNDFDIDEGDILVLKEWDPKTETYTGRVVERNVGYVGRWTIRDLEQFCSREDIEEKGIQVISFVE